MRIRSTSSSNESPGRLGRLRQEAGVGQARDRVDLEHLRPGLLEDQVDPREAGAPERLVGAERGGGDGRLLLAVSSAGQMKLVRPIS